MSRVLGIDVSKWQDDNSTPKKMNFEKAKKLGAEFVLIKASQNTFEDEDFKDNWKASADAGLMRGAYHFYDWRPGIEKPVKDQANFILDTLNGDFGELGIVCDYEKPNSKWPALPGRNKSLDTIYQFMSIIEEQTKEDTISYHNLDFIKNYLGNNIPVWLQKKPLWLAIYPYAIFDFFPPLTYKLPSINWEVKFWQFTDRLDGLKYGAESKQLDGNYWFGTLEELRNFRKRGILIEDTQPIKIEVPKPIEVVLKSNKVKILVNNLRIRAIPNNTNSSVKDYLPINEIIDVIEEKQFGDNIWLRIGYKQWVAKKHQGSIYSEDV